MTADAQRTLSEKLRDRGTRPLIAAACAVAALLTLAALIAPAADSARRELTESHVDQVAPFDVVATHDFTFERHDEDALDAVRKSATAQVVPIWDYDESAALALQERIKAAFDEGRSALLNAGRDLHSVETDGDERSEPRSGDPGEPPTPPSDEELIRLVPDDTRHQLALASPAVVTLVESARVPEGVALEALASDGFRRETQDALSNLVREAMGRHVVDDLSSLEDVGVSGITLRTLRRGQPATERAVRQVINFGDLQQLDALVNPARHHLNYIDVSMHGPISETAKALVLVNTRLNDAETRARADAAARTAEARYRESQSRVYRHGETIVRRGQVVDRDLFEIARTMYASSPGTSSAPRRLLSATLMALILVGPIAVFARRNLRRFRHGWKDLAMMTLVLLLQVLVTRVGIFVSDLVTEESLIPSMALYVALPLAAGSMLVRIFTNGENALIYAVVYSLLSGVLFDFDMGLVAVALISSVTAIALVRSAQTRTDIFRAGALAGVVTACAAFGVSLMRFEPVDEATAQIAVGGMVSGLSTVLFVYALLPIIESMFRYTTPMRLMELANLNHPALRDLILKAPGSYHHSMMVGQLVEAACEAVGADALLGRVGSYFHDIGKTRTPQYFAENQQGTNPHDKLKPTMSALVIKAHVKDGVELARQYKLPVEIVNFIREHHGTSLIAYFHHRAQEQSDVEVSEADFRYPGPKPQSRETAICLIADGIEAASRTLPDPTHARLKGLVSKMINRAFSDGQLDECDLTLRDLNAIAQAIVLRLTAFYHHRPEYPDARKSQSVRQTRRTEASDSAKEEEHDARADDLGGAAADPSGDVEQNPEDGRRHLRRLGM